MIQKQFICFTSQFINDSLIIDSLSVLARGKSSKQRTKIRIHECSEKFNLFKNTARECEKGKILCSTMTNQLEGIARTQICPGIRLKKSSKIEEELKQQENCKTNKQRNRVKIAPKNSKKRINMKRIDMKTRN